jgi:hypothetical protein
MTITSSEIIHNQEQIDGTIHVTERHVDHIGQEYFISYWCLIGTDVNQAMLDRVPILEADSVENELQKLCLRVYENGEDPFTIVTYYATNAEAVKRLLKQFYKRRAWEALYVIGLVNSLSDEQLKNILGIDQIIVDKIRNRIIKLETIEVDIAIADVDVDIGGD